MNAAAAGLPAEITGGPSLKHSGAGDGARSSNNEVNSTGSLHTHGGTDATNAELLATQHQDRIRFVTKWKQWIVWDGARWVVDETGEIHRLALSTVRSMREAAVDVPDRQDREALWGHARKSESRRSLDAMVSLAQKILPLPISHEELNRDAYLLNCKNGTVDLRTGELREHRREDFITKWTPYEVAEADSTPYRWTRFLGEIFDYDAELIAFIQRLTGQILIGEQREHIFPVLYGTGANGKSTFVGTLVEALGEYAITLGHDYLIQSKSARHSTEIMDLYKMRLAVASETEDGARLNEARVKQQTGGGKLRGRRLFQESWEFEQSHTLIVETNYKPRITGTDQGIWRRVQLLPFAVEFAPHEWDVDLRDTLRGEIPEILRWAIDGCSEYLREGLNPPDSVVAATEKYRDESDLFGNFIKECCVLVPGARTRSADLYGQYEAHARGRGEFPLAAKRVEERLEKLGVRKKHIEQGKFFFGISLKQGGRK